MISRPERLRIPFLRISLWLVTTKEVVTQRR